MQLKQIEQDLQTVIIQRRDQLSTPSTPIEECTDETCIPLIITEPQECTDETCLSPTIEATTETNLLQQSLLQSLSDTEQLLEKEKLNYELLKTTHSTQLSDLEHSLQSTRKDYEIAYTTYNKLTIRSPLAGTIQDLFVSIGDTVEEGTPLFSLLPHTSIPTIEVQLSFEEYLTILTTPNVSIILPPATVKTTP